MWQHTTTVYFILIQPEQEVPSRAHRRVVIKQLDGAQRLVEARGQVADALEDGREDQVTAGEQCRRPVLAGPAVDRHGKARTLGGLPGAVAHVGLHQPAPHLEIGRTDRLGLALGADGSLEPVLDVEGTVELEGVQKSRQPRSCIDPSPAFHPLGYRPTAHASEAQGRRLPFGQGDSR